MLALSPHSWRAAVNTNSDRRPRLYFSPPFSIHIFASERQEANNVLCMAQRIVFCCCCWIPKWFWVHSAQIRSRFDIFANGQTRAQMCTLPQHVCVFLRTRRECTHALFWDFEQRAPVCLGINRSDTYIKGDVPSEQKSLAEAHTASVGAWCVPSHLMAKIWAPNPKTARNAA